MHDLPDKDETETDRLMVPYFPNLISRKAIASYFVALAVISLVFMDYVLPFYLMLFGAVEVLSFFYFSNTLTKRWARLKPELFVKRLFWTALIIRLVYMIFIYFFYDAMTGQPFMFHSADEQFYFLVSKEWRELGFDVFRRELRYLPLSDSGEIVWNGLLCLVFGPYILTARIGHCFASTLTCVLIYRTAKRHFGESTARMAAVFCMLMPNLIYYCGIHLKEANMVFVVVLLVDSADALLNERKFNWMSFVLGLFAAFALFTFRTALGVVGLLSVVIALFLNKGRLATAWKRIGLAVLVVFVISITTIENRALNELSELWGSRSENQSVGMENRSQVEGGNVFAKYASGAVFAPAIFTIPFASMVYTQGQENQQMLNGGNFVKNILSGFVLLALLLLVKDGEWRKHALILSFLLGYLAVIAFSNFAHSERFHQPALPFEMLFAAYGISQLKRKHVKWIDYWMILMIVANIGWAWIKLAGRGAL